MISKSQHKVSLVILLIASFSSQGCAEITTTVAPTATIVLPSSKKPDSPLDLSQMSVDEWASTSPDGRWAAVGLVAFPKENVDEQLAYVRLVIFNTDGKIHWTIIDKWQELDLGFPIPAPLKWSQDGKHFYFTHRVTPEGGCTFVYLTDLQRVNLEDGSVDELLPQSGLGMALSPDESRVAYYFGGERGLILRDLVTGEEQEAKIDPGKNFDVGSILWSPDGKSLALTLAINPCMGIADPSKTVWAESTSILLVDAKTLQQKVLVKEDPRLFTIWEWKEPGKITITDGKENALWYSNVNSGEITRE